MSAQKLRYVKLLLVGPWTVTLDESNGYAVSMGSATVRIPNPGSYVVQKLLIHKRRQGKASKDALYIHDTLQAFADAEEQLKEEWCQLKQAMPHSWLGRCLQRANALGSPVHPHVIEATRIAKAAGRNVTAEHIAGALRLGLAFLNDE